MWIFYRRRTRSSWQSERKSPFCCPFSPHPRFCLPSSDAENREVGGRSRNGWVGWLDVCDGEKTKSFSGGPDARSFLSGECPDCKKIRKGIRLPFLLKGRLPVCSPVIIRADWDAPWPVNAFCFEACKRTVELAVAQPHKPLLAKTVKVRVNQREREKPHTWLLQLCGGVFNHAYWIKHAGWFAHF